MKKRRSWLVRMFLIVSFLAVWGINPSYGQQWNKSKDSVATTIDKQYHLTPGTTKALALAKAKGEIPYWSLSLRTTTSLEALEHCAKLCSEGKTARIQSKMKKLKSCDLVVYEVQELKMDSSKK